MLGLPNKTIEHPDQTQSPANCGIAAQAAPVKQQVGADFFAGYYGREDDKDRGACIVCEL